MLFPVLAFLGAGALVDSLFKTTAIAYAGAKLYEAGKSRGKENELLDVNPLFELTLARHLAEQAKRGLTEEDMAAYRKGATDLSVVSLPAEFLPEGYKVYAGKYLMTRRDELLLYYFITRKQVQVNEGQLGDFVTMLAEKSGVSRSTIERQFYGDADIDGALEPLLKTMREMSQHRIASKRFGHLAAA